MKKDAGRVNPGRSRTARIHRVRSELQKQLGVEMVYVNLETREVTVTDHKNHKKREAAAKDNERGSG